LGNHWVCSAINFKKKRFEYYDSLHGGQRNALHVISFYIFIYNKNYLYFKYEYKIFKNSKYQILFIYLLDFKKLYTRRIKR